MSTLSPAQASKLQPQLGALKALREDFYRDFIADQTIEPDEQAILDRIDGKLKNLEALLEGANNIGKTISGSVGKGADNGPDDVTVVQTLLNNNGASLSVDGIIGPKTRAAITAFQEQALGYGDCYVEPGGKTMRALNGGAVDAPAEQEGAPGGGGSDAGGSPPAGGGSPSQEGSGGGGATSEATGGSSSDEGQELTGLPVAEAVEEAIRCGDPAKPIVIDADLSDPKVMDEVIQETNKHLPDQEIKVKQPEGGEVLIPETLKGVGFKGGEISVGISVGSYNGTLKLKLTADGQVQAAVEVDAIPSIPISFGSHGVFVVGEFKPLSVEFSFSTVGNEFQTTCEVSTSGSFIAGIGVAAKGSWAGLGKQMELKVAQAQKMTASLSLETLIQLIKDGASVVPGTMDFSVPCEIVFKGEESLILGASGDVKEISASAAAKLTLESWDPILAIKIEKSGVTVDYTHLTSFLAHQAKNAVPMLGMMWDAYEAAQEVQKFLEDPSAYAEEQRKKAEEYIKFLQALPDVGKEIFSREMRELEAVIDQLESEYEASKQQVVDAFNDVRQEAEDFLNDLEEAGEDIKELAGGAYDDLMNEIDNATKTAGEAIEDAADEIEKGRKEAERIMEEARKRLKDAKDAAGDLLDQAGEAIGDAMDDGRELAEELVDDVADAVEELKDMAAEELAEAADDVLEFADQVGEVIGGVGEDLIKQINEGRKAAEQAKERAAEELREMGEDIFDAAKDFGEDAVEKAKEAMEFADDAREKVEETVDSVWDLVQEATKAAEEKAKGVKDGLQDMAGDAVDELLDLGGEFWDFAEDLSDGAGKMIKSVAEEAKKAAGTAKEQLEDAYHGVEEQVGEFGEDIKEGAEEAIEFLDETRKGVVDSVESMADAARKKAEAVKKQMEDMAGDAGDFVDDATDAIEDTASGLMDQYTDAFDSATDKAGDFAKEAMKKAEEARKLAEAKAKEAQDQLDRAAEMAMEQARRAKEELEKAGKGLMDTAEDAFEEVTDVAGDAADAAKGLLGKLGSLF